MEKELYNLKAKILRAKHISDQLREELANDVFEIEKLVNKTNDIHSVSEPVKEAYQQGFNDGASAAADSIAANPERL